MNDKSGGKRMTELVVLRPQTHSYLSDDNDKDKKSKRYKT